MNENRYEQHILSQMYKWLGKDYQGKIFSFYRSAWLKRNPNDRDIWELHNLLYEEVMSVLDEFLRTEAD